MTTLSTVERRRISAGLGRVASTDLVVFLNSGGGSLTRSKAHRENVESALMLWSTRAASASLTGTRIEGVHDLITALRSLDMETLLERYDHQRNRALLTIYRDLETRRPVGYLFINTPRPNRKRLGRLLGIVGPDSEARPSRRPKIAAKPLQRSVLSHDASNV